MKQLVAIAVATFREAVRNKILYSILFFALALILLAVAVGNASLRQEERIIKDVGLFALHFFSDVIAIFLGVTMVYQEMERKTVYNVLSKPVSRHLYFFGKFAGVGLTLAVQLAIMAASLLAVMLVRGDDVGRALGFAILLTYVECLVVLGFALFFSSFSTPYVSGFLTLGVWLVGGLVQNLQAHVPLIEDAASRAIAGFFVSVAPDFSLFTLSTQITYEIPVTWAYVVHAAAYGLSYAGLFLVAGTLIFNRRDFV